MTSTHSEPAPIFRVLLVQEDIPMAHRVMESFSHVALDCHHIAGSHAVRDALTKVKPHLILIDSVLDNRTHTFLSEIYHVCNVPIILMTQEDSTGGDRILPLVPVDDYVIKPIEPRLLALRVIAHLRRMEPPEKHKRQQGPADWLPYGWAACKACGYRGRSESFRLTTLLPGLPQSGLPLVQVDANISSFTEPEVATYSTDLNASHDPDGQHQPVLSCPRCGQPGSVNSAPG